LNDVEYVGWLKHHQCTLAARRHAAPAKDLVRDKDMISTQLGRVPMYLARMMTKIRGGLILDQNSHTDVPVGPMSVKQVFRDTSVELSSQIAAVLGDFFSAGADTGTRLDVAALAIQGALGSGNVDISLASCVRVRIGSSACAIK
jgi:hypothetical protein